MVQTAAVHCVYVFRSGIWCTFPDTIVQTHECCYWHSMYVHILYVYVAKPNPKHVHFSSTTNRPCFDLSLPIALNSMRSECSARTAHCLRPVAHVTVCTRLYFEVDVPLEFDPNWIFRLFCAGSSEPVTEAVEQASSYTSVVSGHIGCVYSVASASLGYVCSGSAGQCYRKLVLYPAILNVVRVRCSCVLFKSVIRPVISFAAFIIFWAHGGFQSHKVVHSVSSWALLVCACVCVY